MTLTCAKNNSDNNTNDMICKALLSSKIQRCWRQTVTLG